MSNYNILRKMILSKRKNYTRNFLSSRVNTFFAFGELNEEEYKELTIILNENYPE